MTSTAPSWKLLDAAIVLFISAYANLHVYQAAKAKRPNGALMNCSSRAAGSDCCLPSAVAILSA